MGDFSNNMAWIVNIIRIVLFVIAIGIGIGLYYLIDWIIHEIF